MPGLTERERDLPALIGEGLTDRQIGQRLDLAEKTIENPMWRRARPVRVRVFRKRPDFPCRDHLMARMSTLAGPRASTFFLWAGPSASATPPRPTRAGSTRARRPKAYSAKSSSARWGVALTTRWHCVSRPARAPS